MKRGMLHFAYDRKYPVQVMSLLFVTLTLARCITALSKTSVARNCNICSIRPPANSCLPFFLTSTGCIAANHLRMGSHFALIALRVSCCFPFRQWCLSCHHLFAVPPGPFGLIPAPLQQVMLPMRVCHDPTNKQSAACDTACIACLNNLG